MRARLVSRGHEFSLARRCRAESGFFGAARIRSSLRPAGRLQRRPLSQPQLPMGDLVQEGYVGLLQAAIRLDPERDIRFSTYAAWRISSAIPDFIS